MGLQLLEALLESDNFSPSHSFEFGARVRDYGYWPDTRQEKTYWFAATLQLARQFASKDDEDASIVRSMIAQSIWSLWFLGPEVQEQFEAISVDIAVNGYWQEGWIAVRYKLSRLGEMEKKDTVAVARLRDFESRLSPKNITERVRAVVLSNNRRAVDYAESGDVDKHKKPMAAYEKAYAAAEELGKAVCGDQAVFAGLLPDLVRGDAARLYPFGRGLALASGKHHREWDQLTHALAETEENKRNCSALGGFLNALSMIDQKLCEALLEEAVTHQTLGAWFPGLQSSVTVTPAGADRLKRAVTLGKAPPWGFRFLQGERFADAVSAHDLQTIVTSLAKREHGYRVAIDILAARLHSNEKATKELPTELIYAGRELLSSPDFSIRDNSYDYHLQTIADVCLRGAVGSTAAKALCEQIKQDFADHTFHAYNFEDLLQSIFELQPRIALDVFFGGEPQTDSSDFDVVDFNRFARGRRNPLDGIPIDEMLRWCDERPALRYPRISHVVSYDTASEGGVEWTPLAMEMLKRAPDPLTVLKTFVGRFRPRSWSGSRAAIIESRLGLLDRLRELNNRTLDDYAAETHRQLTEEIAQTRKLEDEQDSARDERFE